MQVKYSDIGVEPITTIEVKAWLKVDFADEDTLITSLISQVRSIAEEASGLSLVKKTIEYFNENLSSDWVKLPFPEHTTIEEVKVNGHVTTSYYTSGLTRLLIKTNNFETIDGTSTGLYVKYKTSGYCPDGVKLAMLKSIAETYEKRGNTFEGGLVKLTDNFYNILQQYKEY